MKIVTVTDFPANGDKVGFRLRLRVRVAKAFTTSAASLTVTLSGRDVTIRSQERDQPLSDAKWIVLGCGSFNTEAEAQTFGEQLRRVIEISALCCRSGVDVGLDQPTGWVSEEFARSQGFIKPHERIVPNVHGLMILPDDDHTRIPLIQAEGKVTTDPVAFLEAMAELAAELPLNVKAAAGGIRILNLALMTNEPLAQLVLAFSAIEALGQDETWTQRQSDLIVGLATRVEQEGNDDGEYVEVADALRRSLHRIGLRQGVMRVLTRLGLNSLRKEWDRLYALRSGLFHGTLELAEPDTHQLAQDAISLCGKVILALLEANGVKPPSVANKHFG